MQQFDCELKPLKEVLVEYPITFPPSYPYEEEPTLPNSYMHTRCPAWCDRILMSPAAKNLIVDNTYSSSNYNTIGDDICMGDHKVMFHTHIRTKRMKFMLYSISISTNFLSSFLANVYKTTHIHTQTHSTHKHHIDISKTRKKHTIKKQNKTQNKNAACLLKYQLENISRYN